MSDKSKWDEIKDYFSNWTKEDWGWRWKNFVNIIDDPWDDMKHWLNGRKILWWTIRIPMANDNDPDK